MPHVRDQRTHLHVDGKLSIPRGTYLKATAPRHWPPRPRPSVTALASSSLSHLRSDGLVDVTDGVVHDPWDMSPSYWPPRTRRASSSRAAPKSTSGIRTTRRPS
jgi:hypothetical protein